MNRPPTNRPGTHSLTSRIHRMLFRRLAVASLVIAASLGLAVLIYERSRVSDSVLAQGRRGAERFLVRHDHLFNDPDHLDGAAIAAAFRDYSANRDPLAAGRYVYLAVFTTDGRLVIDGFDRQAVLPEEIRREAAAIRGDQAPVGAGGQEVVVVDGRPWLRVAIPMISRTGGPVGSLKGIFAFSEAAIADFRLRGVRAMAGVVLVVLLTAALIYPIVRRLLRRVTDYSVQLLDANLATLATLGSAVAQRDSDTNAHNYRVTLYSVRLAEEAGLPPPTVRTLIKGAFLHDVGKIGIPDRILLKPGRLDDAEFTIMKTHVEHGRDIVSRSSWLQDALDVVCAHHEQVGGRGYPRGLTGEDIPITARIFAIADVFDALTSRRPYKEPWPFEKAMAALAEGKGTHFDPELVDTFGRIARPLYDRWGGTDDVPEAELKIIMDDYFNVRLDSFDS